VPGALDPALRTALAERLRFYRELGLTEFYRRPVDEALLTRLSAAQSAAEAQAAVPEPVESRLPHAPASRLSSSQEPAALEPASQQTDFTGEDPAISARKSISAPPQIGSMVAPEDRSAALLQIVEEIGDCKRCPLHAGRHSIVFGQGDANARLLFVGEGPGADEDAQGLPFVGRAGQLLNNMITAMGLTREEVYICNVVKCRPPGNRTPEPDEANTCSPFLFRQIDVVRPQVIVALGATAATYLLGQRQPLAGLRGRVHAFRGSSLIVTYHPAYLLRDPRQKKEAWADLQIAMKELGLKAPKRS
jgi:uracil-DNA glycosylase